MCNLTCYLHSRKPSGHFLYPGRQNEGLRKCAIGTSARENNTGGQCQFVTPIQTVYVKPRRELSCLHLLHIRCIQVLSTLPQLEVIHSRVPRYRPAFRRKSGIFSHVSMMYSTNDKKIQNKKANHILFNQLKVQHLMCIHSHHPPVRYVW